MKYILHENMLDHDLRVFFVVEKYEDIIIFISLDQMKQIVWLWLIGPSWFKRN